MDNIDDALLALLQGDAQTQLNPLVARAHDGPQLLSFAQQRLWFLHCLDPQSGAYNMPAALRLRGSLDSAALQRSFDQLIDRHAILRSTFDEVRDDNRMLLRYLRSFT